jgi:hypothetical protein
MGDRVPQVERREIRLPDGRRLTYYPLPPDESAPAPAPGAPAAPPPPPRTEG